MDVLTLLQLGSGSLLYAAFAWLAGSCWARVWLAPPDARALRSPDRIAAALGAAASVAWLWAATAIMSGQPLDETPPLFWMMLSSTSVGHGGAVTVLALLVLLVARIGAQSRLAIELAALIVFAAARASMGHAGTEGLLSVPLLAGALHLAAVGAWTGVVLVSGGYVLSVRRAAAMPARYLERMSQTALVAVCVIAATGIYAAFQRVGTGANLLHTPYGNALLLKLGLVALALALGGFNKFVGLPAAARSPHGIGLVRRVLLAEAVLLSMVLMTATWLITQEPPLPQ